MGVEPLAMRSAMKGDVWSKSFRMAINIAEWHPTELEWNIAINCIQVVPLFLHPKRLETQFSCE